MTRLQLLERRAAIGRERADLKDSFATLAVAEAPDDAKLTELRTRDAQLANQYANVEQALAMAEAAEEAERRQAGTVIAGTGAGLPAREVRVFSGAPSAAPAAFDGATLLTQHGDRVPVLEARHRLADFVPASENRASELGVGGFLRALYLGPQTELERRVLAEGSIGTGGALVPTPLAAEVIDLARSSSVAFRAGARTIPMTSQTLRFARVVEDPEGAWRNENAPIVEDQPAFDAVTMTAKSWALIVRCSRELLEDGQNTDAQLRNVFAAAAGLALDRAVLTGSGTGPEPRGVVNTPGIQTVSMGTNGSALFGYGPVLDAVLALETANSGTVTAVVAHPRTARAIYGLVDTAGQPLQLPPRLASVPLLTTTSLSVTETQGTSNAASSMVLGDWSTVFVGMRTALTISVLNERFADTGQVGFVLWMRADVALARPAAMARITGVVKP
ncbi:phage major capsid protein [Roseomonas sp. BN140053]|uniref:phage major capsid protein n=1 Tax=Roseomonas sp. BN140053 TaxID=3391898 RepID=UPI0039E74822